MMDETRVDSYIESLGSPAPVYLEELAKSAGSAGIPIIRPPMRDFLRTVILMHGPMTILEIGCAVGFSALYMREYAPEECRITTIENYEPRIAEAKANFAKYDPDSRIRLIEGDAVEIVKSLGEAYDLIFMDGPKGQYINMYEDIKRLLPPGGVLISDNILQEGDILESRYAVTRRDRTIHSRMRDYLYKLTHDEDYSTSIVPLADGASLSVRLGT